MQKFLVALTALLMMLPMPAIAFDHSYAAYARVLKTHVKNGGNGIDYKNLKKDPKDLDSTIVALSMVTQKEYDSWSEQQKIAFWINAYNANILKLIIDNYPVESIKKLGPPIVGPWIKKRFSLLGSKRSFYEIENSILRKEFNEPRIHFALNCASASCPVLRNEPYIGSTLNVQLDDAGRMFLRDMTRNRIDKEKRTLFLSKIFDWYKEDFQKEGTVQQFIGRYVAAEDQEFLKLNTSMISSLDYNWSLNDHP